MNARRTATCLTAALALGGFALMGTGCESSAKSDHSKSEHPAGVEHPAGAEHPAEHPKKSEHPGG